MEDIGERVMKLSLKRKLKVFWILFGLLSLNTYGFDIDSCKELADESYYKVDMDNCITMAAAQDCEHCIDALLMQQEQSNPWVDALGVVGNVLTNTLPYYFLSKYANDSQEAWADAYTSGKQACYGSIDSYQMYLNDRGAAALLSEQQEGLMSQCNGYGMGAYAGYGGLYGNMFGGAYNPYLSNGYSSGFLNGMVGPNIYGGGNMGNLDTGALLALGLLGGGGLNFQIGGGIGTGGGGYPYGMGGINPLLQGGLYAGGGLNPYMMGGINPMGGYLNPMGGINGSLTLGNPLASLQNPFLYGNGINANINIGNPLGNLLNGGFQIGGQIGVPGVGIGGYPNIGIGGQIGIPGVGIGGYPNICLLYTSPSPRDV